MLRSSPRIREEGRRAVRSRRAGREIQEEEKEGEEKIELVISSLITKGKPALKRDPLGHTRVPRSPPPEVAKISCLPRDEEGYVDLGCVTKLHFLSTRYTIGNLSVFVEETSYKAGNVQGGYECLTVERVGFEQKEGKEKKPIQMNIPIGLMGGVRAAISFICERRNISVK